MTPRREVFTTGEVAKICHVAPRTVTKWFDSGDLGGYRIPGSRDRRIPLAELVRFMEIHNLPTDALDLGPTRVLLVGETLCDDPPEWGPSWEALPARRAFEAGLAALQHRPHIILFDVSQRPEEAVAACQVVKHCDDLRETKVLAVVADASASRRAELMAGGFHGVLARPIDLDRLRTALRKAV